MSEFKGMTDRESVTHQVKRWYEGVPLHNTVRDECCPDFSCCNGGKIMPVEARQKLFDAHNSGDDETVLSICMMGLSGLCADTGKNVHIISEENKTDLQ